MSDKEERAAELEMEGTLLAVKYKWNGDEILAVCQAALTDANFHREAEIIGQMLDAINRLADPVFELTVTDGE